jgi:hypothetical protein
MTVPADRLAVGEWPNLRKITRWIGVLVDPYGANRSKSQPRASRHRLFYDEIAKPLHAIFTILK